MTDQSTRCFLFLQGPPGPFFAQLATGLEATGHRCLRINFNGGDWFDWSRPADNFAGSVADWPAWLMTYLHRETVTDIILFGDCRPLHASARTIADKRQLTVHVFEEGYIRPDWVILERGGVNGHSSLPRDPQHYLRLATDLPPTPSLPPIPASFRQRAREAFIYFALTTLLAFRYPDYRSHRPSGALVEMAGWFRRLATRPLARLRAETARRRIGQRCYFVLPLQLDSDHQIRTHSPFSGMTEAIEQIIASFAAHAADDVALVIKEHPLDNGLKGWRGISRRIAQRHGLSDRIIFLEHGDIDALVTDAQGVVTINSTTGTLALSAGTPVAVLGTAVYDLAGVTHQGSLADFWTQPDRPQLEIYEAFRRTLIAGCLLRGGFSNRAARAHLLPSAVARLCDTPACEAALKRQPQGRIVA